MVHAAQGFGCNAELERAAQRLDAVVTSIRFGRKRRRVLLLAWDTLFPDIGPVPVSSQRRAMASTFSSKVAFKNIVSRRKRLQRGERGC